MVKSPVSAGIFESIYSSLVTTEYKYIKAENSIRVRVWLLYAIDHKQNAISVSIMSRY